MVPKANDISLEEALRIARSGLEEQLGLSQEEVDGFLLDVNFSGTAGGQWVI